jgi:hypothetical protein
MDSGTWADSVLGPNVNGNMTSGLDGWLRRCGLPQMARGVKCQGLHEFDGRFMKSELLDRLSDPKAGNKEKQA